MTCVFKIFCSVENQASQDFAPANGSSPNIEVIIVIDGACFYH